MHHARPSVRFAPARRARRTLRRDVPRQVLDLAAPHDSDAHLGSRPVGKKDGDKVIAATINGNGSLRVEVTGTGDRTALAGITRLVALAQLSRSRAQALADRAAFVLTLVAIGSAIATLVVWLALGATPAFAIERVVTVLVIACPHALGLAIPLVIAISTTLGARNGLLVRDRRGLEEARSLDTVVFDKTGTLTRGEFRVVEIVTDGTLSEAEALALAAAVERDSEHTIARGIVKTAEEWSLTVPSIRDFRAIPGRGAEAQVDGRRVAVGGPALLAQLNAQLSPALIDVAKQAIGPPGFEPRFSPTTAVSAPGTCAVFGVTSVRQLHVRS